MKEAISERSLNVLEEDYNQAKEKLEDYEVELGMNLPKDKRKYSKYHKGLVKRVKDTRAIYYAAVEKTREV